MQIITNKKEKKTIMIESVYIHIPFCHKICSYCDFAKLYYKKEWVDNYLDALEKEINQKYKNEKIKTIYIGGGTPSSLNLDQLKKLFNIINKFNLDQNLEFTFECNIENINEKKLIFLKKNKVNRLSIGIESFNNKILKILNRKNIDFENTKKLIDQAKKIGFENINIDLIYSIEGQTLEDLKKDLDLFNKLNVEHISIYSLILEKNTKLYINNYNNVDEELELQMYEYITNFLKKNNYIHYEISNYSKKGYESKHNLTYWNNSKYYGFGLGASGYIDNIRYTNTRSFNKYINNDFKLEEDQLTKKDEMELEMILGLRKIKGVNLSEFEKKYHQKIINTFKIDKLLEEQKLLIKDDYIYINPHYLYVSNDILINFLIDE